MKNDLKKARAYEAKYQIAESEKPLFHLTPPVGWMNDPNGFSFYKGAYHLFYQYYPYADHWGPMHWGHSTTKDFIHWNMEPAALAPDSVSDLQGCFSGGAVTAPDGRQALIYTGCRWDELPEGNENVRQRQCIAFGDGKDYEKPDLDGKGSNVILDGKDLPEGFSREDFRDPKIWKDRDGYHMLTVSRAEDGYGQLLSFSSDDLIHWNYKGVIAHNDDGRYGIMWECPEATYVDSQEIYIISGQDMHAIGREFFAGDHTFWFFGNDKEHFGEPVSKIIPHNLDYGFDFYATQTIRAEDDRTILLGWMQNWDTTIFKPLKQKWNGQMTIPRELTVREGTLYQNPVRELEQFRREVCHADGDMLCSKSGTDEVKKVLDTVSASEGDDAKKTLDTVSACGEEKVKNETESGRDDENPNWSIDPESGWYCCRGLKGRVLDLELEISGQSYDEFTIHLAHDSSHDVSIRYDRKKEMITVDRTLIGSIRDIPTVRSFPVHTVGAHKSNRDPLKMRIVMDRFSAEIFVNEGAQAFSMTFYTPQSADEILFETDGRTQISLQAYQIVVQALQ